MEKSSRYDGPVMVVRTLLACVCCVTIAASAWLATMALALHRAGYQALAGLAVLFILQSLLTIGAVTRRLAGLGVRVVLTAGAIGILVAGERAVAANLTGPHFEGYAVIIGAALILQGVLTLWSLYVRRFPTLDRTAPIW